MAEAGRLLLKQDLVTRLLVCQPDEDHDRCGGGQNNPKVEPSADGLGQKPTEQRTDGGTLMWVSISTCKITR